MKETYTTREMESDDERTSLQSIIDSLTLKQRAAAESQRLVKNDVSSNIKLSHKLFVYQSINQSINQSSGFGV